MDSGDSSAKQLIHSLSSTERETEISTSSLLSSQTNVGIHSSAKNFSVNHDDPCWKILPAAMAKYSVNGSPEDYGLYITYDNIGTLLVT